MIHSIVISNMFLIWLICLFVCFPSTPCTPTPARSPPSFAAFLCARFIARRLILEVDLVKQVRAAKMAINLQQFVRIVKLPIPHYGVETQRDSHSVRTRSVIHLIWILSNTKLSDVQVMLVAYSTYVSISVQRMGSQLLISSATETAWRCPTAFSKDRCDQEAVRLRIILSALTTLNFIFNPLPPLPLLFGIFYTLCVGLFVFGQ